MIFLQSTRRFSFATLLIICFVSVSVLQAPSEALAASRQSDFDDLEISGWIPYWKASEGAADARKHIKQLDVIHPFAYSVKQDGTLSDTMGLKSSSWKKLFTAAKKEKVLIIPSIMWGDGAVMHRILSDESLRKAHVKAIASTVKKGKFDGIDIDYEAKWSETKDYFSLFLKELKTAIGKKQLSCTIEARTPPDSLYKTIPETIRYANDYVEINKHCDRVKLMTYDQGRADLKLNSANIGAPYIPVADTEWVRKVAELAIETIDKDKLVLGIPSYGYEYEVTVSPDWFQNYKRLWSFNPRYATKLADDLGIEPSRTRSGEVSFTYIPTSTANILPELPIPANTPSGNITAARALAFANATGITLTFNITWWNDAESFRQKAELAQELGLKGLALFKIDGGEDQDIWDVLK